MSIAALTTYLNDHLAGSIAALELLQHSAKLHKGTEHESFFVSLRKEVEEDQDVLLQVLGEFGGKESRVRKAAAWLGEKVGEAKLHLDDPGGGGLRLLESLETIGLGIQGKLSLWHALEVAADRAPQLQRLDFARLERRAGEQYARVEEKRLQVARVAFG